MWERRGKNIVILVFIDDIEKDLLPSFMKEIISNDTYIEHKGSNNFSNLGEKLKFTVAD